MDKTEITEAMTGDEIVELGYSLIARGLFRIKEREGVDDASDTAWFFVDQVRALAFDFQKK